MSGEKKSKIPVGVGGALGSLLSGQTVNTEGISAAIMQLKSANQNIDSGMDSVIKNAKQLEQSWQSPAGTAACTLMYEVFGGNNSRSAVIQNYINLLDQQVNPGYSEAESVNTSLADMFK